MIFSSLARPGHGEIFLQHPILKQSLEWIRANATGSAPGKHELGKEGWFVAVDAYKTKAQEECQWENHTRTIDLQFMIEGVEGILVLPVEKLGEPVLYKEASDTQKFAGPGEAATRLVLRAGDYVLLMPGEAHCPKVAVGEAADLRKVVVKIPAALLAE